MGSHLKAMRYIAAILHSKTKDMAVRSAERTRIRPIRQFLFSLLHACDSNLAKEDHLTQ